MTRLGLVLTLAIAAALSIRGHAQVPAPADWPQWRGPERTGISRETGLAKEWPASGPQVAFTISGLGNGYGAVAVAGDRIFVQGLRNGQSLVHSLNRTDGQYVWSKSLGSGASNDRGPGPRATPTVDGDRVYVLSETGTLICLSVGNGTTLWQRNILRDFNGRNIQWLISESPLVDGNHLIVTPGGSGATMVALDKMTGRTVWTSKDLSDGAGYSSPVVADVQGVRVIATLTDQAGVGVRASDGKLMWRERSAANGIANIATPVFSGNRVFYTSAYDTGGSLLTLTRQGEELRAQETYFTRNMQNHHGGVILLDGTLYGFSDAILTAIDFASGRRLWQHRSVGKGALTYADGRFYLVGENGVVGLADMTPTGYRETGRFEIADLGWPTWAHPVVSGGRLYIRNQGNLTAYDVRQR